MTTRDIAPLPVETLRHLRGLPSGTLHATEVMVLCNTIENQQAEIADLRRQLNNKQFVLDAWKGHHEKLHPTCDAYGPGGEAKRG